MKKLTCCKEGSINPDTIQYVYGNPGYKIMYFRCRNCNTMDYTLTENKELIKPVWKTFEQLKAEQEIRNIRDNVEQPF